MAQIFMNKPYVLKAIHGYHLITLTVPYESKLFNRSYVFHIEWPIDVYVIVRSKDSSKSPGHVLILQVIRSLKR